MSSATGRPVCLWMLPCVPVLPITRAQASSRTGTCSSGRSLQLRLGTRTDFTENLRSIRQMPDSLRNLPTVLRPTRKDAEKHCDSWCCQRELNAVRVMHRDRHSHLARHPRHSRVTQPASLTHQITGAATHQDPTSQCWKPSGSAMALAPGASPRHWRRNRRLKLDTKVRQIDVDIT